MDQDPVYSFMILNEVFPVDFDRLEILLVKEEVGDMIQNNGFQKAMR